jgi:SAM-dependent methyltransferase
VLDIGAGTGFMSVALALRGAYVVATDVAEQPLEVGAFRAKVSGVSDRIEFRRVASESLEFADNSFDIVTGLFTLHHLDLAHAAKEMHRVLKPGGKGGFVETSGRNKLLIAARNTLPGRYGIDKAGSDDEIPLDARAETHLRAAFGDGVRYHYPDLVFMRMLAANIGLFRFQPMMWALKATDNVMWSLHILRSWSYFVAVELEKDTDAQ